MKNRIKSICSWVLAVVLLFTSFPVLGVYAQRVEDTKKTVSDAQNTDAGYEYRTGDLGMNTEDTETPVILTVSDYYKYAENSDRDYITGKKPVAQIGDSVLPSSVDNSTSPYFPKIGNQGGLGACVVFATTYYQFTYTMNKARGVVTTEDNTFSVKWTYNLVNYGTDKGSTAYTIYKLLNQHGCPTAKALPYDGVDFKGWSTEESVWREAMRYKLKDSQRFEDFGSKGKEITSVDDEDLIPVKTALNNGDVLKFSSYIYSWEYANIKTNPDIPENDKYAGEQYVRLLSGYEGGHGMAIVGYNDNIWCDVNNNDIVDAGEMGAFKIANSWGEGYGNKGFMWIAYDALNLQSCLNGVEHYENRRPGIEDVYRIDVCDSVEGEDMYVKFTLNTADRSQFVVSFDSDRNGSCFKRYFLGEIGYTMLENNCAFDGTNTACDATFVYPLSELDPGITPENFDQYDFGITVKDTAKDGVPLIVKSVSVVNEYTGDEYKMNGNFPITVDGEECSYKIKESSKRNAVVYYIGFDNPVIHYKNGTDEFVSAVMEENAEYHGALYKYVIYDITGDVPVYFSDGKGNTDDNGGVYFSAKEGINSFYTRGQRPPLTIHDFDFANGTPDVNKRCHLKIDVTGGYETYKYKYIIEHLDTGEIKEQGYDYNHEMSPYSFSKEGTYRITVEVLDYANETVRMTKEFQVVNHPFQIESLTCDKDTLLVSKPVQFKSVTAFESIASYGGYRAKSRFVIKDQSGKVWCDEIVIYSTYDTKIKTTTTLYDFIPKKAGEYTLTVSSDDYNKEHAEKTIAFTVYDMLTGDANGDGIVNIKDATAIQQYLVELLTKEDVYLDMSDCDGNTNVNIQDATAIQRYIAGLANCENAGKVIEYTPPTEAPTEPVTEEVTTEAPTEPVTIPVATNEVTFTNSHRWSGTISCYYWSNENTTMTAWPGKPMTNAGQNDFGETLYTFLVPEGATYIIFTNGSEQTVDILYSGGEVRYYPLTTKTNNGYNVQTW